MVPNAIPGKRVTSEVQDDPDLPSKASFRGQLLQSRCLAHHKVAEHTVMRLAGTFLVLSKLNLNPSSRSKDKRYMANADFSTSPPL